MPILNFDDIPVEKAPTAIKKVEPSKIKEWGSPQSLAKYLSERPPHLEYLSSAKTPFQAKVTSIADDFPKDTELRPASTLMDYLKGQIQRKGLTLARGLIEDIPFVRKILPEEQEWEAQGLTEPEKVTKGLTAFARDIALWNLGAKGIGLAGKIPIVSKTAGAISHIPKAGRLISKTLPELAKGAILGATTAETEEPLKIAKKAAQFGAFTGVMPTAMKSLGLIGKGFARYTPKSVKKPFVDLGQAIGIVLRENKASKLLAKRYGEIAQAEIDSELFIQTLEKKLTGKELNILQYLRERKLPKAIRHQILRDPEIRARYYTHLKPTSKEINAYLDDSYKYLVENFGDDVNFVKNYIPRIWNIPKGKKTEVVNWFITRNPHLKKRFVPTLKEGIEKFGLKPKYNKITDVLRVYDQYKIKTVANVKFAKGLINIKDKTGALLIQRRDKAPINWKTIDHYVLNKTFGKIIKAGTPEEKLLLQKMPVKVSPEIYQEVKTIFDEPLTNIAISSLQRVNEISKYSTLTLSLFHATALSETAGAAGIGKEALRAWNPIKIIKAFKKGNYKTVFNKIPIAKEAVAHRVNIGQIMDVEGGNILIKGLIDIERNLKAVKGNLIKRGIAKAGVVATKIRKPLEFNNKFLWEYLHASFKLNGYSRLSAEMIKRFPKKAVEVIKNEAGQFVNDSFGGQVWELLAQTPKWKQFAKMCLLSPDWTLSTVRQALAPFGIGAVSKAGRAVRAELGQDFWRRAIIYFGGGMNVLNYTLTKAYTKKGRFMWDNSPKHKTHLFIGFNPDGTERYLRWGKQFRELPEAIENPLEVFGRKTSPVFRSAYAQLSGYTPTGWKTKIPDYKFWSKEGWVERAKELTKMFIPFSFQQIKRQDFSKLSMSIGMAMSISKGASPYSIRKLMEQAFKNKNKKLFQETIIASIRNKIDPIQQINLVFMKLKSDKKYKARSKAKRIFNRIMRTSPNKRKAVFQKYLKQKKIDKDILPELYKQLTK